MRKHRANITTILGAGILLLAGCQGIEQIDNNGDSGLPGKLVISLTDDPFPVDLIENAEVVITKVEIRQEADTSDYPFMTLMEDTVSFDLMDLRNGITAELLNMEIPAGQYDLIRLYVQEASLTVKDNGTYHVKVPSGAQTGIKLYLDPAVRVEGGLTAEILLDISLENSFVLKGNMHTPAGIKGFNFKPVIRAVNKSTAGSIEGFVSDTSMTEIAHASVWLEQDSVVASAFSDSAGFYAMIGIPAGIYSVYAAKENYDTAFFNNVEIVAANKTIQDITLGPSDD